MSSSSPTGTFSTSPTGPWTGALPLTIAAGTRTTVPFYYLDARAGSHTLTASAEGATNGTQIVTVTPGPLTTVAVTPRSVSVRAAAVASARSRRRRLVREPLPCRRELVTHAAGHGEALHEGGELDVVHGGAHARPRHGERLCRDADRDALVGRCTPGGAGEAQDRRDHVPRPEGPDARLDERPRRQPAGRSHAPGSPRSCDATVAGMRRLAPRPAPQGTSSTRSRSPAEAAV